MQKQIEVLTVTDLGFTKTTGGGYNALEVAYKSEGKIEGKKVLDFANRTVYSRAKAMKQGEHYTITLEKKGDFWNWIEVESGGSGGTRSEVSSEGTGSSVGSVASQHARPTNVGRVTGSTYETAEERKVKQRLIVRQSSISAALNYSEQFKTKPDIETLLLDASKFENWVYREDKAQALEAIDNLVDDSHMVI